MTDKDKIIEGYKKVKSLGYIKSKRKNNTGIGKTFEDYIGITENNDAAPDYVGYEVKSHREEAASYVTLFTKSPSYPKGANAYLKDTYGSPYEEYPDMKKIHTSMFASKYNTYENRYSFRLIIDEISRKIRIGIYSIDSHELIDDSVFYTFDVIEKAMNNKLHSLFYVGAERKYVLGEEYFHYNKAEIYTGPSLEIFIQLLKDGVIMYDIRIGSYKSGRSYGKPHDHGSGFRIKECNISKLYSNHEVIE
jgi:hypothetical protein